MNIKRNNFKNVYKRYKKFMHRYINGTKGVISLFLAILMVPFASIAGSLLNAARINSAVAIFDEALCNASNSTLGTYDEFLRQRFGLLAMSQNTASRGPGYSVQDFISETFEYYMEQNLATLSNTYTSSDVSAFGVYPLADEDVLLSEVLEYGKYTIPTKLVIDGLSIDNLIKELTSDLNLVSSVMNSLSSGVGMDDKIESCGDKLNALTDKLTDLENKITDYKSAYESFADAVTQYNNLIDEIQKKLSEKKAAVDTAQTKAANSEKDLNTVVDGYSEELSALVKEYDALKNEKDGEGKPVDNTKKIAEFKKDQKDSLKDYFEAEDNLTAANNALETAKSERDNVYSSYSNELTIKRNNLFAKKNEYIGKIDILASAILSASEATQSAKEAILDAVNSGVSFVNSIVSTVNEAEKYDSDNMIEKLNENKKEASDKGDEKTAQEFQNQITQEENKKNEVGTVSQLVKAGATAGSTAINEVKKFATTQYQEQFSEVYSRITELRSKVNGYIIKEDYTSKVANATLYYIEIDVPLKAEDVKTIQESLVQDIVESGFIAIIEGIASFINAMLVCTLLCVPVFLSPSMRQ